MPTTLVLLRHGQSVWNQENLFTGWVDVDLSEQGREEARTAGRLLADEGLWFDVAHTSLLIRAVRTLHLALDAAGQLWLPVRSSWRLNERHYGALQGLNKKETAERHGPEQVKIWRRSYDIPPPPLADDDPGQPRFDRRYARIAPDALPSTECLRDVVARMLPYWYDDIVPDLRAGLTVLVAAHGNSLRALVKHLASIPDEEIPEVNIPTGIPLVYELDDDLRPLPPGSRDEFPLCGRYLGDADAAAAAAAAVARQAG